MPRYLFRASYTQSGVAGVLREGGTSRVAAVERLVASVGGKVETQYWTFGGEDFLLIAELPDNAAAAAASMTVGASGIGTVTTTVLLTADEIDRAAKLHPDYRPPGA
ncbi:MAG: GYD domain-containing protein [Chloroflexota bacterium]